MRNTSIDGRRYQANSSGKWYCYGSISDGENYAVLSDILGDEDHLGDMDFKVTGTEKGITACQMDIKIKGLSYEILVNALKQSREGRMHILGEMLKTMPESREQLKPNAPKIMTLTVKKEFIGPIIGPGGKTSKVSKQIQVRL